MPENIQNFQNDACKNIITQGDVVMVQRYVRTILIEETLDDQLLTWEKDDGTVLTYPANILIGLPLHLISADEAYDMTSPQIVSRRKRDDIHVGIDRVVLPGAKRPEPSRDIIKIHHEKLGVELKSNRQLASLTKQQKKILQQTGELTIAREGSIPLTVRVVSKISTLSRKPSANIQSNRNLFFSNASSGEPVMFFNSLFRNQFNNNQAAMVEAIIADPRAGEYYDDRYPQVDVITNLPDSSYDAVLSVMKTIPNWRGLIKNAPTPELPQFSIGIVQVFKQTQKLKGYSRGRLIESVTLGPEETVSVEVFSYDRTLEQREDTRSVESKSEVERTRNQGQTIDLSNEIESTVGATVGAELGVSLPIEAVSVEASVNNEVSAEITNRNQTTANLLTEASSRAAESFTAKNQVKTLTRRETGIETRTTRTFKNPNLGRTLNLHHFEVIGHFETETIAEDDPQFCLLVETPRIGPFDRDWIRAYHDFLDDVLKHDVYREGLEAANLLAAQEWMDELSAAEKRAREEELQRIASETAAAVSAQNYLPNKGIFATAKRLKEKIDLFLNIGTMEDAVETLAEHLDPFGGISTSRLSAAEDLLSKWAWWTQIEAAYPGIQQAAKEFSETYEEVADNSSDPASADDLVAALGTFVERFDDDWLMGLKMFGAGYIISYLMFIPAMVNPAVYLYIMKLLYLPNDKGIPKIVSSARADFAQHKAKQSAETLVPPAPPAEKLTPGNLPPKPPRAYTEKELATAHAAMGRLILHLEENTSHYNNEFYKREDPALRIDRLTQQGIARFVGNRLLGFAGTRSIYPLNIQALEPETRDYLDTLIPDYAKFDIDEAKTTFTVPTGGFVSEGIIGQCDMLEPYLVKRRKHDLRTRELENQLLEGRISAAALVPAPASTDSED